MKVTVTKIWVIAGFLAIMGIAQAQIQEPENRNLTKQNSIESNPYIASNRK